MTTRLTATDLVRNLSDILGRVRHGREEFLVVRHDAPVARIGPAFATPRATLGQLMDVWVGATHSDTSFADDLERIGRADRPPKNPWGS